MIVQKGEEAAAETKKGKQKKKKTTRRQTNLDDDEPGVVVHAEARLHEAAAAWRVRVDERERGSERGRARVGKRESESQR